MNSNKILIFFIMMSSVSAFKVKNCNNEQRLDSSIAYGRALQIGQELLNQTKERLTYGPYDSKTKRKIKGATEIIACTLKKLKKIQLTCTNKNKGIFVASTRNIFGKNVDLHNRHFQGELNEQAATVFHEVTHKCWTNDRVYYRDDVITPSDDKNKNWQRTASTYDWWFRNGVCIPGDDCD
jgi:hypothetical protein